MQNVTRRSFVSGVAAGVTALGALSGISNEADAQMVWKASYWKLAEFEKLVKDPARIKQVYDVVQINDGKFLNNVKNPLNGLRFGFAVPEQQIKAAAALHGPTNMMNYDDYIWEKYQIGAWLKVTDPATEKPSVWRCPGRESWDHSDQWRMGTYPCSSRRDCVARFFECCVLGWRRVGEIDAQLGCADTCKSFDWHR
jgi:hypothetical protein